MSTTTAERVRKSIALTPDEYREFAKMVKGHPTKLDAAIAIDISRPTLDRILVMKSGSQKCIEKIRKALEVEVKATIGATK